MELNSNCSYSATLQAKLMDNFRITYSTENADGRVSIINPEQISLNWLGRVSSMEAPKDVLNGWQGPSQNSNQKVNLQLAFSIEFCCFYADP